MYLDLSYGKGQIYACSAVPIIIMYDDIGVWTFYFLSVSTVQSTILKQGIYSNMYLYCTEMFKKEPINCSFISVLLIDYFLTHNL